MNKEYVSQDFSPNHNPLISIITIVYNGEKHIEQTIQSVINQSYKNIEYIIIDGGSTDRTLDIIRNYEDAIEYWISEPDQGIADAFNKGINCAKGSLIGLINADDYYVDNIISDVSEKYQESIHFKDEAIIIYGKTYREDLQGFISEKESNTLSWCLSVPFSHCSSFISRSYYEKYGLYDSNYKIAMDVDLLMRGLNSERYIKLPEFIATQRDGGISSTNRIQGYKEYLKTSAQHFSIPFRYFCFILKVIIMYKNKVFR